MSGHSLVCADDPDSLMEERAECFSRGENRSQGGMRALPPHEAFAVSHICETHRHRVFWRGGRARGSHIPPAGCADCTLAEAAKTSAQGWTEPAPSCDTAGVRTVLTGLRPWITTIPGSGIARIHARGASRHDRTFRREAAWRQCGTANGRRPPTINRQPSSANRQPPTVNRQPSTVSTMPLPFRFSRHSLR
jgi:hypothetical protein